MRQDIVGYIYKGIIATGFLLPLIIAAAVVLVIEPAELIRLLLTTATSFILIGAFNAIPFVVYAKMLKSFLGQPDIVTINENRLKQKYGLFFAAILGICVIVYFHIYTWISIVKVLPGSSTSGIAFLLLPVYGLFSIVMGYGLGFLVARMQVLLTKNKV